MPIDSMTIEQTLLQEIEESKRWFNLEKESSYKRDLAKRIELLNWVENMKNPDIPICEVIESKMYELLDKIK
jgi:hypothetical protein